MNPSHTWLIKAQWQSIDSPFQIVVRAFFQEKVGAGMLECGDFSMKLYM